MLSIGTDGSVPKDQYSGPALQNGSTRGGSTFMALSPNEKTLFFTGVLAKRDKLHEYETCHAVYRVGLDGREPAKVFVGNEDQPGAGEREFNDPRGLDVDGKGRVYVGDYMNDRIQVFDSDGRFLKSVAVVGPEQVRVHPKTGAVYVLSVRDRGKRESYTKGLWWDIYEDKAIVKFAAMDDWRETARIELPKRCDLDRLGDREIPADAVITAP